MKLKCKFENFGFFNLRCNFLFYFMYRCYLFFLSAVASFINMSSSDMFFHFPVGIHYSLGLLSSMIKVILTE